MDLGKFLKAKLAQKAPPLVGKALAIRFLENLSAQAQKDLDVLSADDELSKKGLSKVSIVRGVMEEKQDGHVVQLPYLFFGIQNKAGFLIEVHEEHLRLLKATKVVPLLSDSSGSAVRPTLIVGQGGSLEEFLILDEETVRTAGSGKTLSLEQCSELLLVIAFESAN